MLYEKGDRGYRLWYVRIAFSCGETPSPRSDPGCTSHVTSICVDKPRLSADLAFHHNRISTRRTLDNV